MTIIRNKRHILLVLKQYVDFINGVFYWRKWCIKAIFFAACSVYLLNLILFFLLSKWKLTRK